MKQALPRSLSKRFIRLGLLLFLGVICSSSLFAQRQISGTVLDEGNDDPLIGASVLVKGSGQGVVTDIDGNFTISANTDDVLTVSYTGYETKDFTVGAEDNMVIRLSSGVTLETLVVTGYSVDNRRQTPGSVSTVKAQDLRVSPSGNVEQQLQGRVAGVTVITNGQPGTTSQVRVRGFGALGGNEPLYVVDGVPVGSIDFLSPDDIETTTVLKDATAASIYGARAAGGVIVYTTKQGKKGKRKMTVTYDGMVGVTTPGQGISVLNPQDQAEWTWNAIRNAAIQNGEDPEFSHPQYGTGETPIIPDYLLVGTNAGVTGNVDLAAEAANYNVDPAAGSIYQVIKANQEGTDWYDEITRNALLNRHTLGFSGGVENGRYYFGLGLQEQEGILLHQRLSRYTFRANSEFDLMPGLSIGENLQLTYRAVPIILGDNGGAGSSDDENFILDASRMSPIIPVYDEFGGYAGTAAPGFNNPRNPVAALDGQQNNTAVSTQIFGNVYLKYEVIDGLTFRTSFGGQYGNFNGQFYTRRQYENSENNSSFGYARNLSNGYNWIWTNTANYKKKFGDHDIDVLVGQEALSGGIGRTVISSGIDPFSQSTDFVNLSTVNNQVVNEFVGNEVTFASFFGRVNYIYQDKYILSAILRRDGSSRFGSDDRYGTFPAVSVAWRLTGEDFMDGVDLFDDLKIRGGYGVMGNSNNVDPLNQFSLFTTNLDNSSYDIGGTNGSAIAGFYRNRIGNPDAVWERAITSNFGIDAIMLDGKLDIGLEVWRKDTEDLLFQVPVTVMTGNFADAPFRNVGKMKNTGFDINVIYKDKINTVGYEITLTGGFLNNEIVELAPGIENLPNRSSAYRGITPVLNQVGQPISAFFGYEVQGLFADQAEVDAAAVQEGAAPGRFRFRDLNNDGVIDIDDRTNLGNPVPDFTGGLVIKVTYQNFDFELYSFVSIGNEIYNISKLFTDFYPLFPGAAISDRVKDTWTFADPSGEIPIFENISNFSTNTQSNSYYVEDGSYFRLQNFTIGYNLPQRLLNRWNLSKFRVFAGANNLVTITGYDGLDPSVGGAADTNFGVDLGNFPITRSYTLGVNLGF